MYFDITPTYLAFFTIKVNYRVEIGNRKTDIKFSNHLGFTAYAKACHEFIPRLAFRQHRYKRSLLLLGEKRQHCAYPTHYRAVDLPITSVVLRLFTVQENLRFGLWKLRRAESSVIANNFVQNRTVAQSMSVFH